MSTPFVLINDAFVPVDQATLRITDLAIQRGYGIFDFFATYNGRPAFLDDHLDRFYNSASHMRLDPGRTRDQLKSLLAELLRKNNIPNSGVRINLTGGYSPDAYSIATPNLIVTQQPLSPNNALAERGARLITHPHLRQFPAIKTIDYLMAVWLQPVLRDFNADDVLYQQNNFVSECPRSNFFIVTPDNKIRTPAANILKGVVRKQVLRLAPARFTTEEGPVHLEDIYNAKEAFMTSTTKGVLPVVQVDEQPIGTGRAGEVTQWLSKEFNAHLAAATA